MLSVLYTGYSEIYHGLTEVTHLSPSLLFKTLKPAVHQQQRAPQMKDGRALQGTIFNDASHDEGMQII